MTITHGLGARSIFVRVCLAMAMTIAVLMPQRAFGQSESASVSGRVTDQQNAVIPNVDVEIRNVDTNSTQVTKTNGDGIYTFASLRPGNYVMSVRKEQFQTVSVTGIALHVQDSLSRNFVLQVGSSAVSITISAADSMWATTDSPAVGTLVTRDFVENMPLNGRSFQDLIALTPGAVSSANGNGLYSINGQRDDANYFMVDGVSANVYSGTFSGGSFTQAGAGTLPAQTALGTTQALLSVDALEEFRTQTSGYTAEYGRQPGGEVQLTTRSGSNDWHGSAFDYLRNTIFDANSWASNSASIPRQAEHQNDFGGTLGGPVWIPGLHHRKNQTFFFFSYEGLRLLLPNFTTHRFYPTIAFRESAPAAVQPFLNAFPVPNGPASPDGITAQFAGGYSNPSNLDAIGIRVDHSWGERVRLFGRYSDTPSSGAYRNRGTPSELDPTSTDTVSVTVGATAILGPTVDNEIRFNYSESKTNQRTILTNFAGAVPFNLSLMFPTQYFSRDAWQGGVGFYITGTNLNNSGYNLSNAFTRQRQYNVTDGLSWIRGKQALKFGVDYRRLLPVFSYGPYENYVSFSFPQEVQQGQSDAFIAAQVPVYPTNTNLSLYGQDHWKVRERLTIDLGVRWEFNPVPREANGLNPLAVTQVSDPTHLELAPPTTPPYHTRYRNFAPRLGFAWSAIPSQRHALVVRGGFGVYYDTGQAAWAGAYGSTSPPFGNSYSVSEVPLPFSAASIPPPVISNPPVAPYQNLALTDPHLKLPYTEQYNLSVDIGLASKNTLTVSYVGNQGHNLLETQYYLTTPTPDFVNPVITDNGGVSNYNALQVQDRGYLAHGLQLIGSYTWAHAMDNVSTDAYQFFAPVRSNSGNDIRQVFNIALNYEIPGARSSHFLRALTDGWLLANRFVAQTGYPFEVIQGSFFGPEGQNINIYPDLVPGVPIYLHNAPNVPGNWELNAAAFAPVPLNQDGSPAHEGNLPRNFLKGPGFWDLNTALERTFPIHEEVRLILRAEAFNVFNHPNFGQIDSYLCDCNPHFGQSYGIQTIGVANQLYATGAPRSWQFLLKLQF